MSYKIEELKNKEYKVIIRYKDISGVYRRKERRGFFNISSAKAWGKTEDKSLNKEKKDFTLYDVLILDNAIKTHAENTVNTRFNAVKGFYERIGETKRVKDIEEVDITNYLIFLKSEGIDGESLIDTLKTVFNKCIEYDIIKKNPMDVLLNFKKIKRKSKKKEKFITRERYLKLIDEITDPDGKLMLVLLYNTGMRISEAMGLYKKNIDEDFIYVKSQLSQKGEDKTLKTSNSYRKIPINKALYDYIMENSIGNDYVFSHRNAMWYTRVFKGKNITSHMFRHTYATRLLHLNIDMSIISEVVGDDKTTIYRKYVEYNKDRNKEENKNLVKSIF